MEFDFKEIMCPVCGGNHAVRVGWRGGDAHQNGSGVRTAIVRCKICTHQYPNPMPFPKGTLDELYVDAEVYFRGHDVETKKDGGLALVAEFERRLGRKGKLLDVGCGIGEVLWAAKKSGWEAEGIDPSREFIELGREKLGVDGRVSTLEAAEFLSESFDAVVMGGILEHLYDPLSTLAEVRRVLRNGGWLFFDAPNEDGLYMSAGNLYMRLRGKDWVVVMAPTFPPYHVQGFNPRSLRTILERAGFAVREMQIGGTVCEQVGEITFRRRMEFMAARLINRVGRIFKKGSYINVWAQKSGV